MPWNPETYNRLLKALTDMIPGQLKLKKKYFKKMEQTPSEKYGMS